MRPPPAPAWRDPCACHGRGPSARPPDGCHRVAAACAARWRQRLQRPATFTRSARGGQPCRRSASSSSGCRWRSLAATAALAASSVQPSSSIGPGRTCGRSGSGSTALDRVEARRRIAEPLAQRGQRRAARERVADRRGVGRDRRDAARVAGQVRARPRAGMLHPPQSARRACRRGTPVPTPLINSWALRPPAGPGSGCPPGRLGRSPEQPAKPLRVALIATGRPALRVPCSCNCAGATRRPCAAGADPHRLQPAAPHVAQASHPDFR